jgi:hypothetical protein
LASYRVTNFRSVWLAGLTCVFARIGSQSTFGLGPQVTLGLVVSSGAGKSPRRLIQKGIFGARVDKRMEMTGAATRISEEQKGGGKDYVTSRRAPWPISTPSSSLSPQIPSFYSHRQAGKRRTHPRSATVAAVAVTISGWLHLLHGAAHLTPPAMTVRNPLSRYRGNV